MSETRFTPGPWHIVPRYSGGINGARVESRSGVVVARITGKADKPIGQKESDARLLADARELAGASLAALSRVHGEAEEEHKA